MSVATSPPAGGGTPVAAPAPASSGEACPLCGAPLHPEQEWCLRCGAAARTRLAASPRWRGLIATLAVVVALSLGVLAAALVKLAGTAGSTAPTTTRTVTTSAAAPATTTAAAGAIIPGAGTSGASASGTTASATTPTVASTGTTATGSTPVTAPSAGKAKAKKKRKSLGQTLEELLHKRGKLPAAKAG